MSTIKAGTTSTTAYQVEADTTGDLVIATGASANVAMTVNSSGNIGIGTSSPAQKLHISAASATSAVRLTRTGTFPGDFTLQSGGYSTPSFLIYDNTVAAERLLIDGSGNLGLGVTPSAWGSGRTALQIGGSTSSNFAGGLITTLKANTYNNGTNDIYIANGYSSQYVLINGTHTWYTATTGTAGNTITFGDPKMTLDANGNLGVGTTSPSGRLDVVKAGPCTIYNKETNASVTSKWVSSDGGVSFFGTESNHASAFITNDTERARITSGGTLLVGQTSDNSDNAGSGFDSTGFAFHTKSGGFPLLINRLADDGTLILFRQASVDEGSISVSGNTVSYNAFAGSHWSQLQDGSKPDILRGTVMESINELCVWPGEQNERLPKSKISDTAGSKKVYGVFMAWDNDWTTTNDMYVTAVGAFICRVNGNVTVQEGDLLESNGDGTARVQADDIIRSSTIGKVTSTVKTHEYDDGSYCVPTVLYCG